MRAPSRRGFSLLELSIAMAMAGIVVAAAASTGVVVSRLMKTEAKKSHADADSRRLVDFVLTNLQGVGGGPVRPWMATWVEPQGCAERAGLPACGDSDRVTLVDVDFKRGSCVVQEILKEGTQVRFQGPDPNGRCCYHWGGIPTNGPPDQYQNQPLMFVRGRDRWAMRIASTEVDAATCTYGLTGVDPLAGWTAPAGLPAGNAPVTAADFVSTFDTKDATATVVGVRTLFIESDSPGPAPRLPRLLEWQDGAGTGVSNGVVERNEVRLVFPGVLSFHVALGYDSAPDDGNVVDTGTNADEWFGNASGDVMTNLRLPGLRMAEVGIITGVRAVEPGTRTLQVLDGAPVTSSSLMLRRAVGRALLRNVAVFF
jgi:prepilin-type N-terminal cleavage/methylation domain-containing protein